MTEATHHPLVAAVKDRPREGWRDPLTLPHVDAAFRNWERSIPARMKATMRRKTILSALTTGCLPWQDDCWWGKAPREEWGLPFDEGRYLLACGYVLNGREAAAFVEAGLLEPGRPDRFGRATLKITEVGRRWLAWVW